jgi:acyl carrier protein
MSSSATLPTVDVVAEQISEFVRTKFNVTLEDFSDLTLNELFIDSLGAVQIAMKVKKKFGIELDNGDIIGTTTISEVAAMTVDRARDWEAK